MPFEPDSNLLCLALNPLGNQALQRCNQFVEALHGQMRSDPGQPRADCEFYGCTTTLRADALGAEPLHALLLELGLQPDSPMRLQRDGARLVVLRHTLMNPFLLDEDNGIDYLQRYLDFLQRQIERLAPQFGGDPAASTAA